MREKESTPDLLIPDGYPEIIFVLNGAYYKKFLGVDRHNIISKSCIVGIQTNTVLAGRLDNCYLLGMKLQPVAAHILLGKYLVEATNTNLPTEDLNLKWLDQLNRKLHAGLNEREMIQVLEDTLLAQNISLNSANYLLASAILKTILSVKGKINVQDLALQHHLSVRHFQRKFKQLFGISPKKFTNIIRFKHLYKTKVLREQLVQDYLQYGYYDQMHFIKDFKKHVGINPSEVLRESFLMKNRIAQQST